jgi:hypothetical protein
MSISRWKIMAGVLGVSLGGIAAIAGQCPRSEEPRTQRTDDSPLVVEAPKVPPAGAGTKPTPPMSELPASTSTLPSVPAYTDDLKLPMVPAPNSSPIIPPISVQKTEEKKPDAAPVIPTVVLPMTPNVIPASGTTPVKQEPTAPPIVPDTKPMVPSIPPTTSIPSPVEFTKPGTPVTPPVADLGPFVQPTLPATNPPAPTVNTAADVRLTQPISANAAPPVATPVATTKFRILLRVGEGEPSFEVRTGDDLLLKVLCEKVDIKSPEKGQSLSAVTASGRVRFVGFGAEGTCDTLSFLAGSGEVSMTGAVKIQVKDKLGRVESELTTDTIKYKLDASAVPGVLKP